MSGQEEAERELGQDGQEGVHTDTADCDCEVSTRQWHTHVPSNKSCCEIYISTVLNSNSNKVAL